MGRLHMAWGCEGRMNDGRLSLDGRLDVDCSTGGGCGTRSGHGIGGPCESLKVSNTSHGLQTWLGHWLEGPGST